VAHAEQSASGAIALARKALMTVFQKKIVPPGPLPALGEPSDVLHLQRTIDSLEQENAWLKERLAQILRDK
jgi:hypothetical protein